MSADPGPLSVLRSRTAFVASGAEAPVEVAEVEGERHAGVLHGIHHLVDVDRDVLVLFGRGVGVVVLREVEVADILA